jgi:peptide/nickel transport system permease protein
VIFLAVITLISFGVVKLAPGDITMSLLRIDTIAVTGAQIDALREELGLNAPLHVQYLSYLNNIARLDFGESMMTGRPVAEELGQAFPYTLLLAAASLGITVLVTVVLGGLSARRPGGWADRATTAICLTGASIPTFWLGLVLLDVFAVRLKLLPAMGLEDPLGLVLPAVALAVGIMPPYIKIFRSSLIEAGRQEFVRAARSRGLREATIFGKHVLRASVIPVVTILGVSLGSLLGGTVIVEIVFGIPGVGKLAAESLTRRDYAVIQAFVLWIGVAVFLINLLVDLSYRLLDPAIALRQRGRR